MLLPSGTFRPYANQSTAIIIFTKTGRGGTDHVWYYDVRGDGWSLDEQRNPLLAPELLGATPARALTAEEHQKNNLPDALARWEERLGTERSQPRTAQSFVISRDDILAADYDLSINRYSEMIDAAVEYSEPAAIIAELREIDREIAVGLDRLVEMLS